MGIKRKAFLDALPFAQRCSGGPAEVEPRREAVAAARRGAEGPPGPSNPPRGGDAASQGGTSETSYLAAICIFMVSPAVLRDCFTGRKGNRKIQNPL